MNTDRLIDTLVHDVAPARPLADPWMRSTWWLLGTVVYLGALKLTMTPVPELAANAADWPLLFGQITAVLAAATAAGAAFALTVPGYPRWSLPLAAVAACVWLGALGLGAAEEWSGGGVNLAAPGEWGCMVMIVFGGALPGLAMAHMLRKGAPLAPALTTALAAFAAAAVANVAACLSHPHPSDAVTFAWHGTTILGLVVVAAAAGPAVLAWNGSRSK